MRSPPTTTREWPHHSPQLEKPTCNNGDPVQLGIYKWNLKIGMWVLALFLPGAVWSRWDNGCEVLWEWKFVLRWWHPCCVCAPVHVCKVCTVSSRPPPWQWHEHWLSVSLFRLCPDLTTTRGGTMAASSWPLPRAWKPTSWSKCLHGALKKCYWNTVDWFTVLC